MQFKDGTFSVFGRDFNIAMLREPRNLAIAAFIVGLIVGLVVLGWWLFPVNWENASAAQLRPDLRADYLRAAINSYSVQPNDNLARQRLSALGDSADDAMATVASAPGQQSIESIAHFQSLLGNTPTVLPTTPPQTTGTGSQSGLFSMGSLLTTLCGMTLIIGLALGIIYVVRNRQNSDTNRSPLGGAQPSKAATQMTSPRPAATTPPRCRNG